MPDLNVRFLKGTQASLNTLIGGTGSRFTAGAFYLTEDSDRLYFAQSATELVPLNQFIRSVTSTQFTNLTSAQVAVGDYYYVSDENLLAICKTVNGGTSSKPTWTQLNPDTNTTYSFSFADGALTLAGSDSSSYTFNIQATSTGTGIGEGVVAVADTTTTANDTIKFGHKAYTPTASTITANQTPAAGGTFNIISGVQTTNGHVTGYDYKTVKIPEAIVDTTYQLHNQASDSTAASTYIGLKGSDSSYTGVLLEDDSTHIQVAADGADKIKVSHRNVTRSDDATLTGSTYALQHDGKFTVVYSVTSDAQGHVTNVKTKEFTLPSDIKLSSLALDSSDKGQLIATLSNGTEVKTAAESFYHNITVDGTTNKVINQGSLGTFYSATEVDRRIASAVAALDAVVYKGTLGDAAGDTISALPTTGVKNGDMYMVTKAGTYGGHSCDVGDLLIAQGTETDGVITSGLTWTYVPSGDDTDTQYTLQRSGNTVSLVPSTDTSSNAGTFTVSGDNKWISVSNLAISHTGPDTTSSASVATSAETASSLGHGDSFTVLTGAVADSKGHIISVKTKQFTLPAESTYTLGSSANSNNITLTGHGADDSYVGNVEIKGGTDIAINGSVANEITINHATITTTSAATGSSSIDASNRKFTALTSITTNNGHVTGYQSTEFTLPAEVDSKYALSGATTSSAAFGTAITVTSASTVTVSHTLTGSGNADSEITSSSVSFQSQTLSLGASGSTVELELTWGTF